MRTSRTMAMACAGPEASILSGIRAWMILPPVHYSSPCRLNNQPETISATVAIIAQLLVLHAFRHCDAHEIERQRQGALHHLDQEKQEGLPAGLRLAKDVKPVVEVVECLRQPEGVFGNHGRFGG